jgi:uncharacterized cupredoxin-like copper-binding protein
MLRTLISFLVIGASGFFFSACTGKTTSTAGAVRSASAKMVSAPTNTNWSQAQRINVILSNFEFTPRQISFKKDQPYLLHLENRSSGSHNFDAPEFFQTVMLRDTNALGQDAIELAKGEAKDIYLVPSKTGTFPLVCSHFMHESMGMTGGIKVH